jgi:small subunit ribosomal protein S17
MMAKNETTTPTDDATTPVADAPAAAATPAPAATTTAPATAASATASSEAGESERPNRRKVREGLVVSTAMDKTAVVAVTERVRHARYAKTVQRTRKLYVHDAENEASNGDRVRVAETRPLSKNKRWRLVEIVERAR